jgi:hypothetical protein
VARAPAGRNGPSARAASAAMIRAMRTLESIPDLRRALQGGDLDSGDRVYVPRPLLDALGPEDARRLVEDVARAGCELHDAPDATAIRVLARGDG